MNPRNLYSTESYLSVSNKASVVSFASVCKLLFFVLLGSICPIVLLQGLNSVHVGVVVASVLGINGIIQGQDS